MEVDTVTELLKISLEGRNLNVGQYSVQPVFQIKGVSLPIQSGEIIIKHALINTQGMN